jgi:hypothetical protein
LRSNGGCYKSIFFPDDLPPFGTSLNDCLHYAVGECTAIIRGRGPYYIGACRCPSDRFWGAEDWKHHHTYRSMYVIGQSTSLGIIRLETEIIARPDIGRVAPLCRNIGKGGERISRSAPPSLPYFLYVVVGLL